MLNTEKARPNIQNGRFFDRFLHKRKLYVDKEKQMALFYFLSDFENRFIKLNKTKNDISDLNIIILNQIEIRNILVDISNFKIF